MECHGDKTRINKVHASVLRPTNIHIYGNPLDLHILWYKFLFRSLREISKLIEARTNKRIDGVNFRRPTFTENLLCSFFQFLTLRQGRRAGGFKLDVRRE